MKQNTQTTVMTQ